MINMIQNAKDQILDLTQKAYQAAAASGKLPGDVSVQAGVEIPKDPTLCTPFTCKLVGERCVISYELYID